MLRLPKVSDPADLMMRNSLYRGTPVRERYLGCPAAQLFNPQIAPAIGKVENLMTYSRSEMAELINRQQGTAEREIQEMREREQEQLEAPASAMEEYYMQILKGIRQKEQAEIDNAYLTQQQKNDLQASALARKAGIDGNLVRRADELAEADREEEEDYEALAQRVLEAEQRAVRDAGAFADSPAEAGGDTELGERTATAMSAAAAPAAASASSGFSEPAFSSATAAGSALSPDLADGFRRNVDDLEVSLRDRARGMDIAKFRIMMADPETRREVRREVIRQIAPLAGSVYRSGTERLIAEIMSSLSRGYLPRETFTNIRRQIDRRERPGRR